MKKFFLKLIIFFSVGTFLLFLLANFRIPDPFLVQEILGDPFFPGKGTTLERFSEEEKVRQVDVLFIGSSHAYKGFDVRIFAAHGLKSFNMGSTGQTPLNSYYLLKEYYSRVKPKIVVLECYPMMFAGDGLEGLYDLSANLPASLEMAEMALAVKNPDAITSVLLTWFSRVIKPLQKYKQEENRDSICVEGGYCGEFNHPNVSKEIADFYKEPFAIKTVDIQFEYLKRMIGFVQKNGGQIVLVVNPLPKEFKQTNTNYNEITHRIKDIADQHHVDFFDFNVIADLGDSKYFADKDHLNPAGVRAFNNQFVDILLKKMK